MGAGDPWIDKLGDDRRRPQLEPRPPHAGVGTGSGSTGVVAKRLASQQPLHMDKADPWMNTTEDPWAAGTSNLRMQKQTPKAAAVAGAQASTSTMFSAAPQRAALPGGQAGAENQRTDAFSMRERGAHALDKGDPGRRMLDTAMRSATSTAATTPTVAAGAQCRDGTERCQAEAPARAHLAMSAPTPAPVHPATSAASSDIVEKLVEFLLDKPESFTKRADMLRTLAKQGHDLFDGIVLKASAVEDAIHSASAAKEAWPQETSWEDRRPNNGRCSVEWQHFGEKWCSSASGGGGADWDASNVAWWSSHGSSWDCGAEWWEHGGADGDSVVSARWEGGHGGCWEDGGDISNEVDAAEDHYHGQLAAAADGLPVPVATSSFTGVVRDDSDGAASVRWEGGRGGCWEEGGDVADGVGSAEHHYHGQLSAAAGGLPVPMVTSSSTRVARDGEEVVDRLVVYLKNAKDSEKTMRLIRSPKSGVATTAAEAAIARFLAETRAMELGSGVFQ